MYNVESESFFCRQMEEGEVADGDVGELIAESDLQAMAPTQCRVRHSYCLALWGGTWPSGQGGALACQRSQVRAPAMAASGLICSDLLLTARGSSMR
jgi:hypothetical protein